MNKKKIALMIIMGFLFLVVTFPLAFSIDVCDEEIDPDTDCLIITPAGIDCNTYTVYNESGQKDVADGAMVVLDAEQDIYTATFNFHSAGAYTITLCANKTAFLTVKNRTSSDPLFSYTEEILDQVNILNQTIVNVNATIEGLNESIIEAIEEVNSTTREINTTIQSLDTYTRDKLNDDNLIYTALLVLALVLFILGKHTGDHAFTMISGFIMGITAIYTAQFGFYGVTNEFIRTAALLIFAGLGLYLVVRPAIDWMKEGFGR